MKASLKGARTGSVGWGLTATPHEGCEDSRGRVASDALEQLQLGRVVTALVVRLGLAGSVHKILQVLHVAAPIGERLELCL